MACMYLKRQRLLYCVACIVWNRVLSHLYDVDGCNNHVLNGVLPNVQQMLQFVGGRPRLVRGEKILMEFFFNFEH